MFTGIITHVGTVVAITPITPGASDMRLQIDSGMDLGAVPLGASICCSGACMTVIAVDGARFSVDVSAESLSKTTLGDLHVGAPINLERSLKLGDEMGGHLVTGHVDAVARVVSVVPENASLRWTFEVPAEFARFVAPKGSVALDGVSLTVNEVDGARFGVNIIPHTAAVTTFGVRRSGDVVNFEIDLLARYVARLREVA